jgi:hypothetical protein
MEKIIYDQEILAIIIRNSFSREGIVFFTPDDFSQQLAFMKHPSGKIIQPHLHNPVPREVRFTQEVLFLKRGRLRVDSYDRKQNYFESRILGPGDVILLASAGHGFEVLEEIEMIEVKQGPFAGDMDKIRFDGIDSSRSKIK